MKSLSALAIFTLTTSFIYLGESKTGLTCYEPNELSENFQSVTCSDIRSIIGNGGANTFIIDTNSEEIVNCTWIPDKTCTVLSENKYNNGLTSKCLGFAGFNESEIYIGPHPVNVATSKIAGVLCCSALCADESQNGQSTETKQIVEEISDLFTSKKVTAVSSSCQNPQELGILDNLSCSQLRDPEVNSKLTYVGNPYYLENKCTFNYDVNCRPFESKNCLGYVINGNHEVWFGIQPVQSIGPLVQNVLCCSVSCGDQQNFELTNIGNVSNSSQISTPSPNSNNYSDTIVPILPGQSGSQDIPIANNSVVTTVTHPDGIIVNPETQITEPNPTLSGSENSTAIIKEVQNSEISQSTLNMNSPQTDSQQINSSIQNSSENEIQITTSTTSAPPVISETYSGTEFTNSVPVPSTNQESNTPIKSFTNTTEASMSSSGSESDIQVVVTTTSTSETFNVVTFPSSNLKNETRPEVQTGNPETQELLNSILSCSPPTKFNIPSVTTCEELREWANLSSLIILSHSISQCRWHDEPTCTLSSASCAAYVSTGTDIIFVPGSIPQEGISGIQKLSESEQRRLRGKAAEFMPLCCNVVC
ncbi:hypothetical protein cand_010540 [Cryptosporidium andersoni]|uniref:Uncharacterized protein n=1 Tax=Cryptosporidium andersoni TaxID=117008 RepID=A0A1J4MQ28_9CRYT|nr:hypothetical protein cand_010540 [Cryptosporidium andersoni]